MDYSKLQNTVNELMKDGNKWIALDNEIFKVKEAVKVLSDPEKGLVTKINTVLTANTKSIDKLKKVAECNKEDEEDKEDKDLNTLFCIIKDLFITKNTKRKYWVEAFLENIKKLIEKDKKNKREREIIIKMLEKLSDSILKNQDNDILKILVQHLEKEEDKKFKLRDTINLRKKVDPTSLINKYGEFEDANITIEIDKKNPIMSRLREISSEKGLRELYICYGDDKETGCWIYPPKRFESFQDTIKRGEDIEIKVSFPSNEKKKNLYKNIMIDKAKKKGIDIKNMYKINYTNINKEAILPKKIKGKNGAEEDKNADPIFVLHPKHLKIVQLDCLYSDGIAVGETVRLYLFDKYNEFNDERHGDVARLMIEEPKTKQITIGEVTDNLKYIIENNVMLPNKPEILFNYKDLALKQNNTEIVDSLKGLKNVYNYSCMYAIENNYNLNYIMFKQEKEEWDNFYNTCKIKSKDDTQTTDIDKIFLFVVNGKGSNQSLRINEKYGTLFFNFSSVKDAGGNGVGDTYTIIDTNIKNINKVLMEKFNNYWKEEKEEKKKSVKIFRLKFDGNVTDVFILTIEQLQNLIGNNKIRETKEEEDVKKDDTKMMTDEKNKRKKDKAYIEWDNQRTDAAAEARKAARKDADDRVPIIIMEENNNAATDVITTGDSGYQTPIIIMEENNNAATNGITTGDSEGKKPIIIVEENNNTATNGITTEDSEGKKPIIIVEENNNTATNGITTGDSEGKKPIIIVEENNNTATNGITTEDSEGKKSIIIMKENNNAATNGITTEDSDGKKPIIIVEENNNDGLTGDDKTNVDNILKHNNVNYSDVEALVRVIYMKDDGIMTAYIIGDSMDRGRKVGELVSNHVNIYAALKKVCEKEKVPFNFKKEDLKYTQNPQQNYYDVVNCPGDTLEIQILDIAKITSYAIIPVPKDEGEQFIGMPKMDNV
jgi:hypothetical protein